MKVFAFSNDLVNGRQCSPCLCASASNYLATSVRSTAYPFSENRSGCTLQSERKMSQTKVLHTLLVFLALLTLRSALAQVVAPPSLPDLQSADSLGADL